ncbi:MAG: prolyl oligopeptidase family serine peptidase [Acidobacteriaceae bacterium]
MLKHSSLSLATLAATLSLAIFALPPRATAGPLGSGPQDAASQAVGQQDSGQTSSPTQSAPADVGMAPLPADKYLWMEDQHGARALAWVRAQDARSLKILESDPHYAAFYAQALRIAQSPSRLSIPEQHGEEIYNLWRDADHVNGIYRKASLVSYLSNHPVWQTVIDYDALGRQDKVNWVAHGLNCLYPGNRYCMVQLSSGGEDAESQREFDLKSGEFVSGGFALSRSKQDVSWQDKDTLLVARDWGPGTMTASGYPFIVKQWRRGTPLSSAKEVFRGKPTDMSARGYTLHDARKHSLTLFTRQITIFRIRTFLLTPTGLQELSIPGKSQIDGLLDGRLLVEINEDWTPAGQAQTFTRGSLLELKLSDVLKDPAHLKPDVVFAPTAEEFLQSVDLTRSHLLITTLKHVQGKAYIYSPSLLGWSHRELPVPQNVSAKVVSTSDADDNFFMEFNGFLTPPSLLFGDAAQGTLRYIRSQPAQFDASQDVVEQYQATSKDGTPIPYFIVHPRQMQLNGANPTILYAYGGFQISMTPTYNGSLGKLWLQPGGVYVLANIRGGGEFGPAWHEAGLKTHRQRIYDDFAAVGEDLIARRITSPRRLGIMGGSNGGLLMGVEMTQHPDLWHAVAIMVPLLDMLRYEKIDAGASWVGEYGSVSNPAERAFLAGISPYNQLKPGVAYPEPFIFTSTKDDRVGPQHARKFAAKMEEFHDPFLYDEIIEGGHAAGANLKEQAQTWALIYTYFTSMLEGK